MPHNGGDIMAWPADVLPAVVEMWDGTSWIDSTADVRAAEGAQIVITRGQPDESSSPQPGSITATLANKTGRYSPRNPLSDLYGKIGRNTPLRVRVTESHVAAGDQTRGVGEVSEWPPRWDVSGADVTTSVTAAGVLRRLGQGTKSLRSPMTSTVLGAGGLAAFWPLEEIGQVFSFSSAAPGGLPMVGGSLVQSGDAAPPGGLASVHVPAGVVDNYLRGYLTGCSATAWVLEYAALADSANTVMGFNAVVSGGTLVSVGLDPPSNGVLPAQAFLSFVSGSLQLTYTPPDASFYDSWHSYAVSLEQSGSDIAVALYVDGVQVDSDTATNQQLGPATQVWTQPLQGWSLGDASHVSVRNATSPALTASAIAAYAGESAADRAERLTTDASVAFTLVGDAAKSPAMGLQAVGAFADNLAETYQAESALVFETRSDVGLSYRTVADLYNQPIALQLDHDADGEIAPDLAPTDDDRLVRNRVTVTRKSGDTTGSSATYEDSTSRMGTQAPPDGVGLYDDSIELNLETDDDLIHHAAWRVHIGTWDEARYPVVRINMTALAKQGKFSTVASVAALDVGDRLRLVNLPVWTGADAGTVDLMCLGFTETFDYPNGWTIEINTVPYGPYLVRQSANAYPDTSDFVGRAAGDPDCAIRGDSTTTTTSIPFDPNFFRWGANPLQDTFARTVASGWGTPDIGPAWTESFAGGGTASVSGGAGVMHTTTADSFILQQVTGLSMVDAWVWMLNVTPASTPSGGLVEALAFLRETGGFGAEIRAGIGWHDDGTGSAFVEDTTGLNSHIAVPGVNAAQALDALVAVQGSTVRVWAALSSVGLDITQAPLVTATTTIAGAGSVHVGVGGGLGLSTPFDVSFGEVHVLSPGSWPDGFPLQMRLNKAPGITGGGELLTVSQIATTEPTYVAAGAGSHADNAAVTPTLFAGSALNDLVLAVGRARGNGTIATPSGYTPMAQVGRLYLWGRVRGSSSPGNPTLTPSGGAAGDTVTGVSLGLRNMPVTRPLDEIVLSVASQSNASAQNIAYPGRSDRGIYPGCVQLLIAGKSDDDTGIAPPSGFTEAVDITTTTGNDQSVYVAYRIDTTPAHVDPGSLVVTGGAAAVSEAMLVTLAGGYQTLTVTRSANDVVKAHNAGTLLAVEHPLILAL